MSAKVRLSFVDGMKGIAIFCIVMFHILLPSDFKTVLTKLIGLFLLMFFCLSGYFYSAGKRTYGQNAMSRFKGLMIPFFKYSFAFWCIGTVYHLAAGDINILDGLCCLRNFYGGCIWNTVIQDIFAWDYHHLGKLYMFLADFWYLLATMFAFLFFLMFADKALESNGKSIGTMLVLIAAEAALIHFEIVLPYNIQNTPYYAMLLLMGAYLHKIDLFAYFEKKGSVIIECIIGTAALLISVVLGLQSEPLDNLFRGYFGEEPIQNMLVVTAAAFFLICGLGILMRRLELSGVKMKALSYMGEHSLHIFIYHMFFAYFISQFTGIALSSAFKGENLPTAGDHVLSVIMIVICILLPLGLERLSKKLKANQ